MQPVSDVKYCTYYGRHNNEKFNVKYACYTYEICCDLGNGCCPKHSTRYYENWCFWIFVGIMVLGCYLLCWYCKKLERQRQEAAVSVENGRNAPQMLNPRLRSVGDNSVDHLLETLILSYRNRLSADQNQPTRNIDETKLHSTLDPPPQYIDALKMPKPQKLEVEVSAAIPDNDISENATSESTQNQLDEDDNFVIVNIVEDQTVPSYEDAIKKI